MNDDMAILVNAKGIGKPSNPGDQLQPNSIRLKVKLTVSRVIWLEKKALVSFPQTHWCKNSVAFFEKTLTTTESPGSKAM
jgi:hypothetical protein